MKNLLLLLTAVILLSSCSRIITGSRQSIKVTSTPSGADVYVMGHKRGQTPLKVKIYKQKPPVSVVVKKEGYKTEEMFSKKRFNPVYILNAPLVGFIYPLIIDRIFYLKKNYKFNLTKGEDQYFTREKIDLEGIQGDYIIKTNGEIIPCIIKSYRRRETVYINKNNEEVEIESFELSLLKFGDKRFELGPNISSYKSKKAARLDNPYDIKILLEYGAINLYGQNAKISLNTDKNGKRSISYLVAKGSTEGSINSINIIKVDNNFYDINSQTITDNVVPFMMKNSTFVTKNNGDEIEYSNLREKVKLYNSCF